MKELLSKRFWQDVKRTFHEALAGPPLEDNAPSAAAVGLTRSLAEATAQAVGFGIRTCGQSCGCWRAVRNY